MVQYISEELVGLALFDPSVFGDEETDVSGHGRPGSGSSTKATRSEFCCISEHIGSGAILYDKYKTTLFNTWPESISTVFQLFQVLEGSGVWCSESLIMNC